MATTQYFYSRLTRRLDVLVRGRLWLQVLIALVTGAGLGVLLGPDLGWMSRAHAETAGNWLALPGKLFLALIGMVIIPLAASSIVLGIAGSGGGEAMQYVGRRLAVFVLATTVLAAMIGVTLARLIRPGFSIDTEAIPPPSLKPDLSHLPPPEPSAIEGLTRGLPDLIVGLIPQNITASMMDRDMLAIVIFSLLVGIAVVGAEKRELTRPIVALSEAVLEVSMTVIRIAMRFAPLAVFGLIAQTTLTNGVATLVDLALYCGVVLSGLFILLLVYLFLAGTFGGVSPLAFLKKVAPVQLLAFSTSSSAAVMPLTMKTAVDKLGVPPSLAGAVIPLAATVNMAGTALYQAAAIVFLADLAGVTLTLGDMALIMITLTGASIGAPAAPGASIAILSATATSFGVPLVGLPLVMGVDRILDMARTTVNVTGDLVLCRILARSSRAHGLEVADAPAVADSLPAGS
ncbi:dicarboxylate/amino acid:cation symporter [Henriciella aquimarina]|uniref:dicarboxylate/amino acid:cation symporter n=1 Tax=Henriciella aquimarina TaxID=545261 RepID=UPI0009FD21FE|nr:dicarboxylate/amino acid:cation symporter [Henriciella aquimarina]